MMSDESDYALGGIVTTQTSTGPATRRAGPPPDLPGPPARRLRRPGVRDPRLLVGVVLVAASAALGSWAVGRAGRTVPVYAVASTLVPGDPVAAADLLVRDVRIDDPGPYLLADADLPADLVVLRPVGAGELLPRAAVGPAGDQEWRPIALTPRAALPSTVGPGSLVDLWLVPEDEGDPSELAAALVVAEVDRPTGAFAATTVPTLHVLVPQDLLPEVLAGLAGPGTVEVVAVPGGTA